MLGTKRQPIFALATPSDESIHSNVFSPSGVFSAASSSLPISRGALFFALTSNSTAMEDRQKGVAYEGFCNCVRAEFRNQTNVFVHKK